MRVPKILQNNINFGFHERLFLCWSQNDILHLAPVAECLDLVCCDFGTHLCFCQKQKTPKTKKWTTSCVWWQSGGCFREILSVCSFTLTCSGLFLLVYLCSTCAASPSVFSLSPHLQWDPCSKSFVFTQCALCKGLVCKIRNVVVKDCKFNTFVV